MSSDIVIATYGLTKTYGDVQAVQDIDIHVKRGEIYALIGRNGAGKTTTIRMLLGLIRPSSGKIQLLGQTVKPGTTSLLSHVGSLVETATAYPNLTVIQNLDIQRRLTCSPPSAINEAIELLHLGAYKDRLAGKLSLGNRQRLAIARAMLHKPEILILDEPINSLDPAGIIEIRKLLKSLVEQRGVTVFLSSHILSEVAHLADRVGIVHEGKLIEELEYQSLSMKARDFVDVTTPDQDIVTTLLKVEMGLEHIETREAGKLRIYGANDQTAEIARTIITNNFDLFELVQGKEDLEEYFMDLTEGV
jgi:ABC-2 type transport system ATP-binding protein